MNTLKTNVIMAVVCSLILGIAHSARANSIILEINVTADGIDAAAGDHQQSAKTG